ncbi:germ cell-less protein-like 1 [Mya arenaria]|uniref:germ cell-less protein-like 1 n=1 Tax=Mya arenaria TaxID=6604 RepID=UPI0022E39800|nr:germ cell-less protein-like 1 [Mya arenaria]
MGNSIRFLKSTQNEDDAPKTNKKRKHEDGPGCSEEMLEVLNTPKRKRIKSTSKYIYQTLFLDGENSDVTLKVCGKAWKLHKLYLKQSPYFSSMFGGLWKESSMDCVEIDVVDSNITEESLKIAFGSLYKDDIFIKPIQLTSVIATATLLQLEGLLQHCAVMIKDTVSSATVCEYYQASSQYGMEESRLCCLDWLTRNVLVAPNVLFIRDVSPDLMVEIVGCPHLYVIQVEIDLYTLLKKWIFLIQNPTWDGENKDLLKVTDAFFKDSVKEMDGKCYLEADVGWSYVPVFTKIRWNHVVNDLTSVRMIENDKIVPIGWLDPMFLYSWWRVLTVEQGHDKGPVEHLDDAVFNERCTRFGRILHKSGEYCWRWIGYSYGVDLLLSVSNGRLVTVKRNTHTQTCPQAVSLLDHRNIAYRLTISSFDTDGKEKSKKTSGIKHISLGKDEEEIALVLDSDQQYPLAVSMNVVFLTPGQDPLPTLKLPNR